MAAPTCQEGVEAGSCHPRPFQSWGRGRPEPAAGACRLLQLANEVSYAARGGGLPHGRPGVWEGRGPRQSPRPTAFLGLGHSLARTPHSQAKSNTASTAPAHCWSLPGRSWP